MSTEQVLIVSNHAGIVGGGEVSLLTLVRGLTDTRWRPVVAVPGPGEIADRCHEMGVAVHEAALPTMRRPGARLLGAAGGMRRLISETNPAVVHANGSRAMFYAGLASRVQRVPVVWHIRIALPDPLLDRVLVRLATVPVAISATVRERLRPWPDAHGKCRVIPNGLDLGAFVATRGRAAVRAELGIGDDELAVMCVSRMVDGKRQELLLDACAALAARSAAPRCVLVGDGPGADRLRRRANDASLAGRVIFTGHRDDVADLLGAADMFVLPAEQEGFGRVVIEAMAAGLPVVAADAGGPAEIVDDDTSGLLFAAGSPESLAGRIERLCNDPALRRRLGAAARRRVEGEYTMQAHTRRVVGLYEELLEEPDARRDHDEHRGGA